MTMIFRPGVGEPARSMRKDRLAETLAKAVEPGAREYARGGRPTLPSDRTEDLPAPAPQFLSDFEAYVREVARLEGLDPDEMVRDTREILDRHGDLLERMIADGSVR